MIKMQSKMTSLESKAYFGGAFEVGKICRNVNHFESNEVMP